MVDCEVYVHLNAIVGNANVPGGFLGGDKNSLKPEGDGVVSPKGNTVSRFQWPPNYKQNRSYFPIAYKLIRQRGRCSGSDQVQSDIRSTLVYAGCQPTQTMGSSDEVVQAIANSVQLCLCVSL